ncbi:ATP-binding protein [Streptomyces sirii]|uniref:ATP-binding protein n=1 Tax=Streptomyces sirii TaxID=3127701 RepID=UPI003D35C54C
MGQARDFVLRTLAAWNLEGRADDVRLCVSELATNALAHGTRRDRGFHVAMSAEDDIVRVEVHDSSPAGPGSVAPPTTTSPDAACTSSPCSAMTGASRSAE